MRIPHESDFQKLDGMSMSAVVAFSMTVKSTIERASDAVTTYGYHHRFSVTDQARTTGRTGSTHGARIVSIPARREVMKSVVSMRKY